MAWTAEKINKSKSNGNVVVDVRVTDGDEVVLFQVFASDLTDAIIADKVAIKIASLEARDAAFQAIELGPVTPAKIEPSPYEVAYRNLLLLEDRIARKIDEPNNQAYLDALALVKTLAVQAAPDKGN